MCVLFLEVIWPVNGSVGGCRETQEVDACCLWDVRKAERAKPCLAWSDPERVESSSEDNWADFSNLSSLVWYAGSVQLLCNMFIYREGLSAHVCDYFILSIMVYIYIYTC